MEGVGKCKWSSAQARAEGQQHSMIVSVHFLQHLLNWCTNPTLAFTSLLLGCKGDCRFRNSCCVDLSVCIPISGAVALGEVTQKETVGDLGQMSAWFGQEHCELKR